MKKLFLASSLCSAGTRFQEFVGRDIRGLRVLFITTAAEVEPDTSYVDWTRDYFRKVGVEMIDFTVTGKTEQEIQGAVDSCDILYLEGGNTYYLLQQLRLTGADIIFTKAIENGKFFVATSAGSIVCGPDISPIGLLDDPKKAPLLKSTKGLSWTQKVILPHYGLERVEGVKKIQADFGEKFTLQILTDKQAIAIVGDQETLAEEQNKSELYIQLEKFVDSAFQSSTDSAATKHLRRTVDWLKTLKPDADEALVIAARAHDIERAFRQEDMKKLLKDSPDGFGNAEFLRLHQTRGAELLGKFLREQGANETLVIRVKHLVGHHEDGGDDDQNVLKDADTMSFFENNIEKFLVKHAAEQGREKVAKKFQWMYERLTSEEARKICLPWYKEAMKRLK